MFMTTASKKEYYFRSLLMEFDLFESPCWMRVGYFSIINGTPPSGFSLIHVYSMNYPRPFQLIIQMAIQVREGETQT
jgi:hypothetical protein